MTCVNITALCPGYVFAGWPNWFIRPPLLNRLPPTGSASEASHLLHNYTSTIEKLINRPRSQNETDRWEEKGCG